MEGAGCCVTVSAATTPQAENRWTDSGQDPVSTLDAMGENEEGDRLTFCALKTLGLQTKEA